MRAHRRLLYGVLARGYPAAMRLKWLSDPRALALADQLLVSLGTFLVTLVAARSLDTPDFSALSLTLLIALLLANVHRAAVTQPANVLGASDDDAAARHRLAKTLSLTGVLAVLSSAVFAAVGASIGLKPLDLLLGWLVFVAFSYQDTLRRHAYTRQDLKTALALSGLAQLLLFCGLGLLHATDSAGKDAFLGTIALSSALAATWGARRIKAALLWQPSAALSGWHENRPMATWLLLTVAAVWGASQVYMFLGAALGPLAVAYLAASRNILNALNVFSQTLANYIPSRVAVCRHEDGMPGVRRFLYKNLLIIGSAGLGFLLIINLAAEPILRVLYGDSFSAATDLLRILAIGNVMSLFGTVLGTFCFGLGDSRSSLLSNLAGTAFTLSFGIWMTVTYGLVGLAWAMTISLTITALSQGQLLARIIRLSGTKAGYVPTPLV